MTIDFSESIKTVQGMLNVFVERLPHIVLALVIFLILFFLARFVRSGVRRVSQRHRNHENVGLVFGRLAQWLIVSFGFFIAITLMVPSVKVSTIIQLLGVSSIAVGFAFKDILQNFLAGILILLNQPFKLRDQIKVGEFEGTVEDIQTRATFIKTYDGRRIVIPNSKVFTESVVVNTAFQARRSEIIVGIGVSDNLADAKNKIEEAILSVAGVEKKFAPDTVTTEFGPSSVNIRARWWSKPDIATVLQVQDKVVAAIKTRLAESGIDIPFPTHQVLFHDQTEPADGDRRRQREGWPASPHSN